MVGVLSKLSCCIYPESYTRPGVKVINWCLVLTERLCTHVRVTMFEQVYILCTAINYMHGFIQDF